MATIGYIINKESRVTGRTPYSCCRVTAASIYMQMALFTFLGCIQQGMGYQGLIG